jgi:NitT/TauT family transport system substrate-binding protein
VRDDRPRPWSRRQLLLTIPPAFGAALLSACVAPATTPSSTTAPSKPTAAPTTQPQPAAAAPTSAVAATVAPATPRPLQPFRFISWSPPRTEQAHIFVANELGYFRDEGIAFEYIPGQGAGDAVKQLLAGNGDIAFAGAEGAFFTADQGGKVMAVYNSHPQNVFVLAARADKNIRTPTDLKGKTIGVLSMASGGRYNVLTVLAANGMQESDVTLVATGPAPGPFLQGQIDAWSTISTTLDQLIRTQNLEGVTQIRVKDYANTPTETLIVTGDAYTQKREVILRFLRAIRKGQEYTLANVEPAVQIAVQQGLDVKEVGPATDVVRAFNDASQSDATRQFGLGWFELDVIQQAADLYTGAGLLQSKVDVRQFFTNDLVTAL